MEPENIPSNNAPEPVATQCMACKAEPDFEPKHQHVIFDPSTGAFSSIHWHRPCHVAMTPSCEICAADLATLAAQGVTT